MTSSEAGQGSRDNVTDIHNPESLIRRRIALHEELGMAAIALVEAQKKHTEIVAELIGMINLLRSQGVDVESIVLGIQGKVGPHWPINDYGKGDSLAVADLA